MCRVVHEQAVCEMTIGN